jgi:prepilin-type N-terminal cleavage/methylation domain-containing protein
MNNELRTANSELRVTPARVIQGQASYERRGFTLVELVVAIAILAMVILFAGTIFKESIGSYRVASAQAEIMQKLRVITEQLDSDFKGLRKDAPMFIWFQLDPNDPNQRLDQIMFFADGDFQSTQLYSSSIPRSPSSAGTPVIGNLARIYYGQAKSIDPRYRALNEPVNIRSRDRMLARRQHISTADTDINSWPDPVNFASTFDLARNDSYEHDRISLSQWQALANDLTVVNQIIVACIGNAGNSRPTVNLAGANGLYMLMTEGVGNWSVQWAYLPPLSNKFFWWPSVDPDENGNSADSDFGALYMNSPAFGIYFNAPGGENLLLWFAPGLAKNFYIGNFSPLFFPSALKFTFTLYDSRGVFREGQTFTHIVYIGD